MGPAGSVAGITAYFFVFLIFESPLLNNPCCEALKLSLVCLGLFLLGLIPYVDNYAHIGGFVFGFFVSGIVVSYGNYKKIRGLLRRRCLVTDITAAMLEEIVDKLYDSVFLLIKLVLLFGGLLGVLVLTAVFVVLLYVVQNTWVGFSFVSCIPFTSTLCIDQQDFIRDRDGPFII